jgi:hypothetical protein
MSARSEFDRCENPRDVVRRQTPNDRAACTRRMGCQHAFLSPTAGEPFAPILIMSSARSIKPVKTVLDLS